MSIVLSKIEKILLIFLVAGAAFLRFYNFTQFMTFLDDQGRDALVAKRMLIDYNPTLLGPRTSVGNMYLGPLYYYFMVPFLAITYPSPVGPALAIATLGTVSVALMYLFGRKMIGKEAAFIASVLFAFAPTVVDLSRYSWQPNPAPFVSILMLYCCYLAVYKNKKWWIGVSACFTVLTQLHYVAMLSFFPALCIFIWQTIHDIKHRTFKLNITLSTIIISLLIFLLSFAPLVLFNVRHDGIVFKGFITYFSQWSHQSVFTPIQRVVMLWNDVRGVGFRMIIEILGVSRHIGVWKDVLLVIYLVLFLGAVILEKDKKNKQVGVALALWIGFGVVGLSAYRNTIYEHYFAYLFPALFLSMGFIGNIWARKHILLRLAVYGVVLYLTFINVKSSPYFGVPPSMGIKEIKNISQGIEDKIVPGEKYNIALLNDNREYMGMKYRYFLSNFTLKPESEYVYTNLDKLVVIVENDEKPLDSPIFEIEQFVRESNGKPELVSALNYENPTVHVYIYKKGTK